MTFGDMLAAFGERLWDLWPVRVVDPWEVGIRTFWGRITGPVKPGVQLFCPLVGSIEVRDGRMEVTETEVQTVRLSGGVDATFSLGVKWRVRDAVLLYGKVHDEDESVVEAIRSAAGRAALEFKTIEALVEGLADRALEESRKVMRGWGVDVIEVNPINLTAAPALRLIVDAFGG